MSRSYLKQLPTTVVWLIRPALFLSVGLHLLLLLLPILPDRTSEEDAASTQVEPEETQVALTPLPIAPTPEPQPAVVPSPMPSLAAQPPVSSPPAPIRNSAPTIPQPQPVAPSAAQPPILQPTAPVSPTSAQPSPAVASSPAAPPNRIVAPFASFPHLDGSQPGCFDQSAGDCQQISGNFRQVSQALTTQLSNQGYDVKQRNDLEETGRQVYEVTKDEVTRYLSVISSDLAGTAYILASEPVTQADIEQIATVQTELQTLLDNLGGTAASATQFAYPEFFFTGTQLRPEINGQPYVVNGTETMQLTDRLMDALQANGFQTSQIGEYGGGSVYEVGQKAFLGYINLVPTQDGTGTIVVLWQRIPQ